jgi:hypothetical protein
MRISRWQWGQSSGSGFPDFLDEFAPLLGRDLAGLERGDVDDLAIGRGPGFEVSPLEPLAAHFIGTSPVIAHELEALARDV